MNNKPKVLLLFSGGFDSTTLLLENLANGNDVTVMYFDYGQGVADLELERFHYWVDRFQLKNKVMQLPKISWSQSVMLGGESSGDSHKDEYIEMRNLIFVSYAISYAEANKINEIQTGFIGDATYPDANPLFIDMMNLVSLQTIGSHLTAPYGFLEKEEVFEVCKEVCGKLGISPREVLDNIITCNIPVDNEPCWKCNSCLKVKSFIESI